MMLVGTVLHQRAVMRMFRSVFVMGMASEKPVLSRCRNGKQQHQI